MGVGATQRRRQSQPGAMDGVRNLAQKSQMYQSPCVVSVLMVVTATADSVMKDWKEPYHAGRGVGRYSVAIGSGVIGNV